MFELTEVMSQRGDSEVIDLLNNVRAENLNSRNINMIQSRIIQPEDANYHKIRSIFMQKMQLQTRTFKQCWNQLIIKYTI